MKPKKYVQFSLNAVLMFPSLAFCFDRPVQLATFERVIFRAVYTIQSYSPDKRSVLICCELDVINVCFTGLDFDMYVYVTVKSAAFISEPFLSLSQSFTSERVGVLKGIWTLQVCLRLMEVILINYWSL